MLVMDNFNILTNDPSITAWGWAVISAKGTVVATGCIKTAPEQKKRRIRKSDDTSRRASEVIQKLLKIIRKYDVKYLLSESPHGSQNASAAVMIGLVTGITCTISECLELPIEFFSEGDSKKCTLGKLSATKGEMIDAIKALYEVDWKGVKYMDEAIADAISVYHVACEQSPTIKMLKNKF